MRLRRRLGKKLVEERDDEGRPKWERVLTRYLNQLWQSHYLKKKVGRHRRQDVFFLYEKGEKPPLPAREGAVTLDSDR